MSLILLSVWLFAVLVIISQGNGIPVSMLIISSIFFVLLLPAMNDLVRSIERGVADWLDDGSDSRENK